MGIAAEYRWDSYLPAYLAKLGQGWSNSPEAKDLIWRSRSSGTPALLEELILAENSPADHRYYRALDFQTADLKNQTLKNLLAKGQNEDQVIILRQVAFDSKKTGCPTPQPGQSKAGEIADDRDFLEIVRKYQLKDQKERLLGLVYQEENRGLANQSAGLFAALYGMGEIEQAMKNPDETKAIAAIRKFGAVDTPDMANLLAKFWKNDQASTLSEPQPWKKLRAISPRQYSGNWPKQIRFLLTCSLSHRRS
ncbi:hypothetical protein [Algoriphagus boritolerans]|uniref:hypothetical protein n=1 Tax=Algoriphagus boritolerans TaxID=308111 RepID=UPI002FCDE8C9